MSSRVLVADKLDPLALDMMTSAGLSVEMKPGLKAADLTGALEGVDVLVVRSTKVVADAINTADRLGLIVRAGSGTNNIDVQAASAAGVYVANCPGQNSIAVAELAIGLILAIDRRLADNVQQLRAGKWDKASFSQAAGIKGRKLGVVGFGAIGRALADRARALEMSVVAYSRSLTFEEAEALDVKRAGSLEDIFSKCDVVSLHVPLSEGTRGMIDASLIALMKPGAVLINTARAEVVDEAALLEAVRAKKIFVGTDVFHAEPEAKTGAFTDPLGAEPNVYGTHHIGASTDQSQRAIAQAAADIVVRYVETGRVETAVNVQTQPRVEATLVVRHLDRVGVLASVLATLRAANINVQTMENIVFSGEVAASARIMLSQRPDDAVVQEMRGLENVLGVDIS